MAPLHPFYSFSVKWLLSVPPTVVLTRCPGGCLLLRLFTQPTQCRTQGKFLSKSTLRSGITSWWNRNHPLLLVVVLGWVFAETRIRGPQVYSGSESGKHQWRKRKGDKEGRQPAKRCYQAPTWATRVYTPEELYRQCTKVLESSQLEWGSWVFVYHTPLAILWGCFSSPHPGCVRHMTHNLCFLKKTPSCR